MNKQRKEFALSLLALLPVWIVAVGLSFLLSDCGTGSSETAVPRRTAYPRIELYDTSYKMVDELPVELWVNRSADVSRGSHDGKSDKNWINVHYPRYGATLYCTYTSLTTSTASTAIDNRIERMSLNAGDLSTEISRLPLPEGGDATLLVTPESRVTPIQFLATDSVTFMVSGALSFDGRQEVVADSVRPILDAVKNDVLHALTHLKPKE